MNSTCDNLTGQCFCLDGVTGRDCSQCEGDTYGINSGEGCKPCNCNPWGTINKSKKCDQVTGQCECIPGRTRYEGRTCDGCRDNFMFHEYLDPVTRECVDCGCHETGSQRYNCSTYEGKCDCNPGIVGTKCDTRACRLEPWTEWSDCQIREGRCLKMRYQYKIEPATGDHNTIPNTEDCSNPNIQTEECTGGECDNFSRRLKKSLGLVGHG
eukprot:sb/3470192/